jgi:hypothetical protein
MQKKIVTNVERIETVEIFKDIIQEITYINGKERSRKLIHNNPSYKVLYKNPSDIIETIHLTTDDDEWNDWFNYQTIYNIIEIPLNPEEIDLNKIIVFKNNNLLIKLFDVYDNPIEYIETVYLDDEDFYLDRLHSYLLYNKKDISDIVSLCTIWNLSEEPPPAYASMSVLVDSKSLKVCIDEKLHPVSYLSAVKYIEKYNYLGIKQFLRN